MGLLDSVKNRLGMSSQDSWDDPDDYDQYDEYYEDGAYDQDGQYPQNSNDIYDTEQEIRSGRVTPRASAAGGASGVHSSRHSDELPLISDTDIRSLSRNASQLSTDYVVTERGGGATASGYSQETLLAAKEELEALTHGGGVPAHGFGSANAHLGAHQADGGLSSSPTSAHNGSRLKIVSPSSYSDAESISVAVRAGKAVVLSLTYVKPELATRLLDFSFGVASATSLSVQKLSKRVFLIAKKGFVLTDAERSLLDEDGLS
jgi:cell division inhibitor SepF